MVRPAAAARYALFWRWHFYAGLFVLPFILILSVTGTIYLFKPQIDRWEERNFLGFGTTGAVSADRQLEAAAAAVPGARFEQYRLPRSPGDAAAIRLALADGAAREVFVSPQGRVIGVLDPATRITAVVSRLHGSLLIGRWGDWLVELAASWTIVMILTGLYLWWPRPLRAAGTLWPRLGLRGRPLLKDLHRVTGFWIAALVLVTLASGLPWAGVWGSAFAWSRGELGLVDGPPEWKIGTGEHAGHGGMAVPAMAMPAPTPRLPLATFVAHAQAEHLPFPVQVLPPQGDAGVWTVKSKAQNRPLNREVTYDAVTGDEVGRRGFGDQHVIDRIVGIGVAWHEGQLFGVVNQIVGTVMAVGLVAISIVGALMWWRRRPAHGLGAPPFPADVRLGPPLTVALVVLGVLLPLFGASLLAILLVDRIRAAVARHTPHRVQPAE